MAKARPIPEIGPDSTFREAAASAVEVRTAEVFSFAAGVLDRSDIERVHDMRVASRRLRAVLEVFAPAFPKKPFRRCLEEVKALADDLGERRDPDVAIAELERVASALTPADRPGIAGLVEELAGRQEGANEVLRRRLERIEEIDLRGRLHALAAAARTK